MKKWPNPNWARKKNGPIIQPKFRFTDTDKPSKSSTANLFEYMALNLTRNSAQRKF